MPTKKKKTQNNKKVSESEFKNGNQVTTVNWLRGRTKRFKTKFGTNVFITEIKPVQKELWCISVRKNQQRLVLTYEDVKKLIEILSDMVKSFKPDQ